MKTYFRILYIVIFSFLVVSCSFNDDSSPTATDNGTTSSNLNNPSPGNNSTNQPLVVTLSWNYDGGLKTFDVYFDDVTPPRTLVASNRAQKSLIMPGLDYNRRYYWRVVANNPNGSDEQGPVWTFRSKQRGTTADGYVLIDYGLETELPSYVNLFFQVIDLNGIGIDNLTTSDFRVYEDGEIVTPSESDPQIIKRDRLDYTLRLVLMLDNSSSLLNDIDDIILQASDLVNSLNSQFEMAVYKFSEDPVLIQDFTSDKGKLLTAINDIRNGIYETTDLYGAVIEGAGKMQDSVTTDKIVQTAMVVFTDGDDTQAEYTLAEALEASNGKRIYTVGLGPDIQPEVLETIGYAGFFAIGDVSELSSTFADIKDELDKFANSFYQLRYKSPKRGNRNHDILMQIIDNPNNSVLTGTFNSRDFFSTDPGLYINASVDNPYGITDITLPVNGSQTIQAGSYLTENTPEYEWVSLTASIVEVSVSRNDNSVATIRALGNAGQTGVVRVRDLANNLTATLNVKIQ